MGKNCPPVAALHGLNEEASSAPKLDLDFGPWTDEVMRFWTLNWCCNEMRLLGNLVGLNMFCIWERDELL